MPEEKIDRLRPVEAAAEPKKAQQRLVDETVDESFPASDPPAWTTTGNKSVAARYDERGQPIRGSSATEDSSDADTGSDLTRRASEMAQNVYEQGQRYFEEGRRRYPEVERYARRAGAMAYDAYERAQEYVLDSSGRYRQIGQYSRRGVRAVASPVRQYPIAAVLAAAAAGYFLATLVQSRSSRPGRLAMDGGADRGDDAHSPKRHGDKYAGAVRRTVEPRI